MPLIGEWRMQALWQVLALIWQAIILSIVTPIILLIGLIWMIIDVLFQFIFNSNGLSAQMAPAQFIKDLLKWHSGQLTFAITGGGDGSFMLTPF